MTALTLMPIRLATRRSCATARMALPIMVRRITQSRPTMIDDGDDEHQDFLWPDADACNADHLVADGRRDDDLRGAPDRQARGCEHDPEAEGAHHPGHARLAGEWPHGQHIEEASRDSPITMTEPSAATSCCQPAMRRRRSVAH